MFSTGRRLRTHSSSNKDGTFCCHRRFFTQNRDAAGGKRRMKTYYAIYPHSPLLWLLIVGRSILVGDIAVGVGWPL
jgi:hypothetical protein